MPKSATRKNTEMPTLLARLAAALGSQKALCRNLGVAANYATAWSKAGYIPEQWALEIEALGVSDDFGPIDAYSVLYAAAEARRKRLAGEMG